MRETAHGCYRMNGTIVRITGMVYHSCYMYYIPDWLTIRVDKRECDCDGWVPVATEKLALFLESNGVRLG